MKILIICVTYNSYDNLLSFLLSVDKSTLRSECEVSVIVADNSDQKDFCKQKKDFLNIKVDYLNFPNLGYFGSAFSVINNMESLNFYDYIMITNVDLNLDESFFLELSKIQKDNSIGWIAPDIISLSTNTHHNPYRTKRITKKSLSILAFLYKHPILLYLYQNTLHFLKVRKRSFINERGEIYAGHGSCFIFSQKFLSERQFTSYPCFLFGEEIFIAEELKKVKMTTWYEPSLKVYDYDHVSTSKMKKKHYYNENLKSVIFLRNKYF